jgi:hypothetical protein
MLASILSRTFDLVMFRAGPQDFPFLAGRHATIAVVAGSPIFMVYSMALTPLVALAMAAGSVLGVFLAAKLILRWRKLDARFTQTAHAQLAVTAFLTALMILPFAQIAPLLAEMAANPGMETPPDVPAGPVLIMNALNLWGFMVTANIYRHATDSGFAMGLLYSLTNTAVVLATVLMLGSVLGAVAPGPA